jgi:twinkle protein
MELVEIKSGKTGVIFTISIKHAGENPMPCPECSENRKQENKNKKSFSWNNENKVGFCQNCGTSFGLNVQFEKRKDYSKPDKKNFTKLIDTHLQWFSKRGISQATVNEMRIATENNLMVFQYIRSNRLINVKKRDTEKKVFLQGKDCEQIMYNYDNCIEPDWIVIVEGEIDALSYIEAGIKNVTSVSQGAPNLNDKSTDKKLECITNCYELFENKKRIFIHTDKDVNGEVLRKEIIRRLGAERCFIVPEIDNCKDANDILCLHSAEILRTNIEKSKEVKIDGIITIYDVCDEIFADFKNGQNRGTTTYYYKFDNHFTWRNGEVTIWTGYNNEGKSTFLRQLQLIKSVHEDCKWGMFAPEDYPSKDFYADLIHTYVGKSVDKCYTNCMNDSELIQGMESIKDWFYLVDPPKDRSIESIFELMKYLVTRKGINGITIDPYNQIEHAMKIGEREDLYISRFMSQLKKFAVNNDIIVNLVAHQVTPDFGRGEKQYPKPNIYRIKGGGTFADKADNVISVWRPNRFTNRDDPSVLIESQKIKKQRLVGVPGELTFDFDRASNRYFLNEQCPLTIAKKVKTYEPTYETSDEPTPF